MNKLKLNTIVVGSVGLAITAYASVCMHIGLAQAQAPETPDQLYSDKCSACHNLPDPTVEALTVDGWKRTVNRMLVQHGASDSISADQATTILAYLDKFAVPNNTSPIAPNGNNPSTDVWSLEPSFSHVYMYSTEETVETLHALSGRMAYRSKYPDTPQQLIIAAYGGPNALITEPIATSAGTTTGPRDLQVEGDFLQAPPAPGTTTSAPLSFGLAFEVTGPKDYSVASYDDTTHAITISKYVAGTVTTTQTMTLPASPTPDAYGWHHMKLIVVGGQVKVWLDYQKLTITFTADPNNIGDVGVWSGSRAVVKDLAVDVYPPASANGVS